MKSRQLLLQRIAKALFRFVFILVFFFVIAALLIQIPYFQTKIVRYATSFVSNKTGTKVEIGNISISFPKTVVLEGLYLEDLHRDTLLFAGKAKVNISLYKLFQHTVSIGSIHLEEVSLALNRNQTDSLFNYNFLLKAFADTTIKDNVHTITPSKWIFNIEQVSLINFRLNYHDEYAGMILKVALPKSELVIQRMDLDKSSYEVADFLADKMNVNILATKSLNGNSNSGATPLPKISVHNLQLTNSRINYVDSVGSIGISSFVDRCTLTNGLLDLQIQSLGIDNLFLANSRIQLQIKNFESKSNSVPLVSTQVSSPNWKISMAQLDLENNYFVFNSGSKSIETKYFDPDHIELNHLCLVATDAIFSADLTKIRVQKFSTSDQNKFAIDNLAADFRMDPQSLHAAGFKASTPNSSINADLDLQYASLASLTDSLYFRKILLNIRNSHIKNSDLLYFKSDLNRQPFFQDSQQVTKVSGTLQGDLSNLNANNLEIETGKNTSIETDFQIIGLPDYKKARYNFPNLKINSGEKDIREVLGSLLPETIGLPDKIGLLVTFGGGMKSFDAKVQMQSSFGNASYVGSLDSSENFSQSLILDSLNLGRLLKDSLLYGPLSLKAGVNGHGLTFNVLHAKINSEVSEFSLNKYTYHSLKLNGTITDKELQGKISLNDENAVFDLTGLVNRNPGKEHYKFSLNLNGADLQKLNFIRKDARISFAATTDLVGGSGIEPKGMVQISQVVVASQGKKYLLDTFLTASVNEPAEHNSKALEAIVGIQYHGNVSPSTLTDDLKSFVNRYFQLSNSNSASLKNDSSWFSFEMKLHNHPLLTEVLLPQLKEFEPVEIRGTFDPQKSVMMMEASVKKIAYGSMEINDLQASVNADPISIGFKLSSSVVSNPQFKLDNFSLDGKLANNKLVATVSSISDQQKRKLLLKAQIGKVNGNYKLTLSPNDFYLMNNQWNIAADNFVEFGKEGFLVHHLFFNHGESHVDFTSVNDQMNGDLKVDVKNFKLEDISGIIEQEKGMVKGNVEGTLLFKRVASNYGIVADAWINNLFIADIPIGNLVVKAENKSKEKFIMDAVLSGPDNNISVNGYYLPNGGDQSLGMKAIIHKLSMKTVEAFSIGQIKEATGSLSGELMIGGNFSLPDLSGELLFSHAIFKPTVLNNRLELKNETIQLKKDGVYFNTFTILDAGQHAAILDGVIRMKQFTGFSFDLQINTKDFLLFNTTAKNNKEFFGRMVIDSKIGVTGSMKLPTVNARVKLKKGSNFTFSVPEDKLTTDKGENVVEFDNTLKFNPILIRNEKKGVIDTGLKGFHLSSILEIDKEATLRLLLDPATTDSLVVKGEAALSLNMDQSGKMSLTGAYHLNEGSYLVSLESVIKKKFEIDAGSSIIWNGDPMDAEISMDARYSVRASPYDLVAGQLSGPSSIEQEGYKQRYPFLVVLKLRGQILHPEINFAIQLLPEDKGILGGAVDQKLGILNEDISALNKQVFALLVLGRFVQENPFQSETAGTSTLIRSTVGKFLTAQLNQLSSKIIPGMDLNFDIQSFDDYQSGLAKGRTQVGIGLKKQLFNERLSVQLGGSFDVEGDMAKQNSAGDMASDVTLEYKLTKDGRYRLKGFRHSLYEGAIDGQLVETGAGFVFVRDFNKWRQLFTFQKSTGDSLLKHNKNVPILP